MHQVFLSKTKQHQSNAPFPGCYSPARGVCSTWPHRVRTFRLHPIIFHRLLGPATLLHHRAFQKVTRDFWDSRSKAPSLSLTSVWHSELLTAPFLKMHFWLQELYTPLVFLLFTWQLLCSLISAFLSLKVKIPQGPALGSSSHHFYSTPRQRPRFQLSSMRPSPIHISSSDLCSKFQIHMLDCSLYILQIPVDQHAHNWNHLFLSFAYIFQLSNLHGPYLKRWQTVLYLPKCETFP